ncbi:MAG: aminoacyl-tRNA hydrolase [Alphaproteobacteria bacterium]|nr:aminoacyl-tRNA hydrolase [Alphaproteobacteria bacterium]MBR2393647.1 aminoacyl-tRNA hydrolase [Alphaproteobacteria bacterium]
MQENKPILVVGLGNPGAEYVNTRHNVGFMAVDALAGADATWKKEKNALVFATTIDGRRVIFVKPQTYMNNSGVAVLALMTFYKVPLENIIVIHDDMDLKIGDVREKIGGGSAGHNGIKSIDANVGRDYKRVRIGIGHPRDFDLPMEPADWVLGRFGAVQIATINNVIDGINLF